MRRKRLWSVVAVLALAACAAADETPATTTVDLSGKWSGCWRSDKNGHHGKMTASFCRIDDCSYRGTFVGTFWKVFPFFYTETFTITAYSNDQVWVSASKVLGPRLGRFDVHATATATHFTATFQSSRDWGVFLLERK